MSAIEDALYSPASYNLLSLLTASKGVVLNLHNEDSMHDAF